MEQERDIGAGEKPLLKRDETLTQANARLVTAQAALPLAQLWGGGDVASADRLRFRVPVQPSAVLSLPGTPRLFLPLVNAAFGAVLARQVAHLSRGVEG